MYKNLRFYYTVKRKSAPEKEHQFLSFETEFLDEAFIALSIFSLEVL